MHELRDLLLTNAVVLLDYVTLVWIVSLIARDASIIDVFWAPGFALVAWVTFGSAGSHDLRGWLLAVLITVWAARLAGYLAWRNHGQTEDRRYRAMREARGDAFWWQSYFVVFLLQGALMWIVSLPLQVGIHRGGGGPLWLIAVGVAAWAVGLLFESAGDYQLARFKANPGNRGEVMDRGLWRYTRHPNYFGDFLVWWGLFAVSVGEPAQLWTAVGPAVMTVLLLRVSGVALLEKDIAERRPAYRDYIERTSAFVPWPPRRRTSS